MDKCTVLRERSVGANITEEILSWDDSQISDANRSNRNYFVIPGVESGQFSVEYYEFVIVYGAGLIEF